MELTTPHTRSKSLPMDSCIGYELQYAQLVGLIEFRSFRRPSSQVRRIGRTERIARCNLSQAIVSESAS